MNNKVVLIRCDFNVPIKDGKILDNTRIIKSLKTIKYCISKNAKIVLFSHLGRIKSEEDKKNNSLIIVKEELENLLDKKIIFIDETRGEKLEAAIKDMSCGDVVLVENTRFEDYPNSLESKNDDELGKYWASLGDVFVNDAFGTLHRKHASNVGIATHIKESCSGYLVSEELSALNDVICPDKPFVIILGGAKVKDKIGILKKLVEKADKLLIGGGMAFTFLCADGYDVGNSIIDGNSIDFCKDLLRDYPQKIILPVDIKTSKEFINNKPLNKDISELCYDDIGMDIGVNTESIFINHLKDAKTVFWNGPLGVYEFSNYAVGTDNILKYLIDNNIKTIVGGGDIVAACSKNKDANKIYHISTGGGATLSYIEDEKLDGLECIK